MAHKIYEALPGAKRLGQKIATSTLHTNAKTIARVLSVEFPELTYHVVADASGAVDSYRAGELVTDEKIPTPEQPLPPYTADEITEYAKERTHA